MPLSAAQLATLKANQNAIDTAKTALATADIAQLSAAQTNLDNAIATQDAFLGTLVADTTVTPPPPPPPPPNAPAFLSQLGVYQGALNPAGAKSFGTFIGAQPTFAMDFFNGDSWATISNPSNYLTAWEGKGYKMIWGLPVFPGFHADDSSATDTTGSEYGLAQGAKGAYNQYITAWAQAMVKGGAGSDLVRLMWEFNGGWFGWAANGRQADFIAFWQQVVNTARAVPGFNCKWIWNPTLGDQGVGNLATYYPGNAFVDYVGLDAYDQAWGAYPGTAAEWNTILNGPYGLAWLAGLSKSTGKPMCLPEWGLGNGPGQGGAAYTKANTEDAGGDNPGFINDTVNWIAQQGSNFAFATFYDVGFSLVNATTNPNTGAALKAAA